MYTTYISGASFATLLLLPNNPPKQQLEGPPRWLSPTLRMDGFVIPRNPKGSFVGKKSYGKWLFYSGLMGFIVINGIL